MKPVKTLAGVMASVAFFTTGSAGLSIAQASTAPPAPAYYVAEFEVTDPVAIKPYRENVESTLKPYGGHFIVRGGNTLSLEGNAPVRRMVIIKFENIEKAKAWYNSYEYTNLRKIRLNSANADVYLIDGVAE
ncbi:DUF1330 domain-containing protein [Pseudomonas sp. P105]|uniref:DUF1330 domain-containing protein n=1 Tax=Pseudomonas sp. P105 TaxID=3049542 RepID=UPI0029350FE3|nr:DUF1330 domain-containing protein [Pseudomonas sp. P105]WNZ80897.1 DUF1330 domain-containing protein [Pseudomonas sp. P105]